mgnify:CR=1 FL=1
MQKEIFGGIMSRKEDHLDIALVSQIIKDGVMDDEELGIKYARCCRMSDLEGIAHIRRMRKEGKVGYYKQVFDYSLGMPTHRFVRWNPKEDHPFPPTRAYLDRRNYFRRWFREA